MECNKLELSTWENTYISKYRGIIRPLLEKKLPGLTYAYYTQRLLGIQQFSNQEKGSTEGKRKSS